MKKTDPAVTLLRVGRKTCRKITTNGRQKQWMIGPNSVGFSEDRIIPLVLVIVVSERRHSEQLGKDAGGVLNSRDGAVLDRNEAA